MEFDKEYLEKLNASYERLLKNKDFNIVFNKYLFDDLIKEKTTHIMMSIDQNKQMQRAIAITEIETINNLKNLLYRIPLTYKQIQEMENTPTLKEQIEEAKKENNQIKE
jgi:GTPase involved in cell partitioning and DNA repair